MKYKEEVIELTTLETMLNAAKCPYDSGERMTSSPARLAALAIIDDLLDRRGIGHALTDIDLDIKEEIVGTMVEFIEVAMELNQKL